MKRIVTKAITVVAILVLAALGTGLFDHTLAAGPTTPTSTTSDTLVAEGNRYEPVNPFKEVGLKANVRIPNGKIGAGELIATVNLTVDNVGVIPYALYVIARPAKAAGPYYPVFDAVVTAKGYSPGQPIVILPGGRAEVTVEISFSYSSPLAPFEGLVLDYWPGPAPR